MNKEDPLNHQKKENVIQTSIERSIVRREYPFDLTPEIDEIEKNKIIILEAIPIHPQVAFAMAEVLYMVRIPEIKEVIVLINNESGYSIQLIGINNETYRINASKDGFVSSIWKEGDEEPVLMLR